MRRFKLKTWYPSLPKDWKKGMEVGQGDRGSFGDFSPCNIIFSDKRVSCEEVEGSPEFWEEIIENTYQVLKVNLYNGYGTAKIKDYSSNISFNVGISEIASIITVKRKSDGKIFTLGDTARSHMKTTPHKIAKFSLEKRGKSGSDLYVSWADGAGGNWLNKIEKYEPLFTSVDNQEVYWGQTFYVVDPKYFKIHKTQGGQFQAEKWTDYRYKDEQGAINWLIENKPCLSYKDIHNFCTNSDKNIGILRMSIPNLKKLIKTKL